MHGFVCLSYLFLNCLWNLLNRHVWTNPKVWSLHCWWVERIQATDTYVYSTKWRVTRRSLGGGGPDYQPWAHGDVCWPWQQVSLTTSALMCDILFYKLKSELDQDRVLLRIFDVTVFINYGLSKKCNCTQLCELEWTYIKVYIINITKVFFFFSSFS